MTNPFDCKIPATCIYNNLKINKHTELAPPNGKLSDAFPPIYDDSACGGMTETITSFALMERGK